jgi:hypothetical protein
MFAPLRNEPNPPLPFFAVLSAFAPLREPPLPLQSLLLFNPTAVAVAVLCCS